MPLHAARQQGVIDGLALALVAASNGPLLLLEEDLSVTAA